jgi:hypothetical protein
MSISDSEEVPGHVYAAELDGTSVIVKHYWKKQRGLQESVINVARSANYWRSLAISWQDWALTVMGHYRISCIDFLFISSSSPNMNIIVIRSSSS